MPAGAFHRVDLSTELNAALRSLCSTFSGLIPDCSETKVFQQLVENLTSDNQTFWMLLVSSMTSVKLSSAAPKKTGQTMLGYLGVYDLILIFKQQ